MREFKGVFVPISTPFTDRGELDEETLRSNIDWYIENRVHGIVPCGSTGEFLSLTEHERKKCVDIVIDQANGRIPVIVGASSVPTSDAIMYGKYAEDSGADGVMVVSPYYYSYSEDEVYQYFKDIDESIGVPMVIYNNPFTTKVDLKPEFLAKCAAHFKNFEIVKESSADASRVSKIIRMTGDRLSVFCGEDSLPLESFMLGAKGWVATCSNVVPRECVSLYELAVEKKDLESASRFYKRLYPFIALLDATPFIQNVKACLEFQGRSAGRPRKPLLPINDEQKEILLKLFNGIHSEEIITSR
jgi:4-hydroxy-tetrahydrodipicolinate synthase